MNRIFLAVSFFASLIGSICGIGGGVIIKPILDAMGVMSVNAISFLSGCTVLSMSVISVGKSMRSKDKSIDMKIGTLLAVGASVGGIVGKQLFQLTYIILPNENKVGAIQASVLLLATIMTFVYTINKSKIKTHTVNDPFGCILIGLCLGVMSAFLGIGGGPINLVVLAFFFSMETKVAAVNSIYIIMYSQLTSLISSLVQRTIPEFSILVLFIMVLGGLAGGSIGSKISKKISSEDVNKLFLTSILIIIGINIYNLMKFLG